jgi:hypothetical protein
MKFRWLFLLLLFSACDDFSECGVTDASEEIYVNFYNIDSKADTTVTFQSSQALFPSGPVLVDNVSKDVEGYILPLDMASNMTDFIFTSNEIDYDLQVGYTTKAFIENPDCGPIFLVRNITAQSVAFDSVVVKVTELSKNIAPHVEIYF